MADAEIPTSSPNVTSRTRRKVIAVAILAVVAAGYWFLLPALQWLIIPGAPGGKAGPWVVRPIQAFHFGAMAVMAAVTLPCVLRPLQRRWQREDAVAGTTTNPFHGRAVALGLVFIQGILLLGVYAAGLVFYLFSWTTVGPDGMEQRLPWTTLKYAYQDIAWLETIPEGERSESITQNGPWYSIRLKSGRSITLSEDNEGTTREELHAITTFISDRSGIMWTRRTDSRPRGR